MSTRFSFMALVLAAVAATACDSVPLGAPSDSSISVTTQATALPPGGSTEVTAYVLESAGTPVQNGTLVRFSATLGTVNPAEVETRNGLAVTTFVAGSTSGTARVRATSGGATGGSADTQTNVVEIQVGGAAAANVSVSASPSRVGALGGEATIVAAVSDAAGNQLAGVPVSFSTTAGTLSSSSAATDATGAARVTLSTTREATVTARVGSNSAQITVSVSSAPSVTLATTPASPVSNAPVTLTVTPASGTTPRVTVAWGDGQSTDLGVVSAARTVSHVYSTAGSYVITATAAADGDTATTATGVTVGSGASITLSAPDPASPLEDRPVTFTVTPVAGSTPRVVIDWGDGSSTDLGTVVAARGVVHVYTSPGAYVVTATSTAGGDTFTTSRGVTVQ